MTISNFNEHTVEYIQTWLDTDPSIEEISQILNEVLTVNKHVIKVAVKLVHALGDAHRQSALAEAEKIGSAAAEPVPVG